MKKNTRNTLGEGELELYKSVRWMIIIICTIIYVLLMINIGIFSSASTKIKTQLGINNQEFGFFGSVNSTGRIVGTFIFMAIVNKVNRKFLIIFSLYINAASIIGFTLVNNLWVLYAARTLNGVCQVFGFIYFPIWIDQFGIQRWKTLMLTFIQLASPLGMVLGYALNIFLGGDEWRKGFLIEGFGEFIFVGLLLFFPNKYFSKSLFFKCHFDGLERLENGQSRACSIFYAPAKEKKEKNTNSFVKNLQSIFTNQVFIYSVLYKSIQQIICCGLGFWLTDYLENGLNVQEPMNKLYSYVIVIVVGPMIGMSVGGFVGSLTGGYEKKFTVLVIFVFHTISSFIGICVTLTDNVFYFNCLMVGFFIFNSAVMPVISGLVLWSLPKNLKGLGNGISSLATTFLGKFPSTLIYGFLQEKYGKENKKIGMFGLMSTSFIGIIFLGLCTIFRYRIEGGDKGESLFEKNKEKNETKSSAVEKLRNSINQTVVSSVFNEGNELEPVEGQETFYENTQDTNEVPQETEMQRTNPQRGLS